VIRAVADPGVLVSALLVRRGTPPDALVRAWRDDRIELVACPALLAELERVLRRPKFWGRIDEKQVAELLERLRRHATMVDDPSASRGISRDPDDDYLIALARETGADVLVSGDGDLLALDLPDLQIVSPREIVDRLDAPA
jgi:putative PIN family toxin of toxin-antitoxin system